MDYTSQIQEGFFDYYSSRLLVGYLIYFAFIQCLILPECMPQQMHLSRKCMHVK
jgi:hypothetical protein